MLYTNNLQCTLIVALSVHLPADVVEDVLATAAAAAACSNGNGMAAHGSVAAAVVVAVGNALPAVHSGDAAAAGGEDGDAPCQAAVVRACEHVPVAAAVALAISLRVAVALSLPALLLTSATWLCTTQLLLLWWLGVLRPWFAQLLLR